MFKNAHVHRSVVNQEHFFISPNSPCHFSVIKLFTTGWAKNWKKTNTKRVLYHCLTLSSGLRQFLCSNFVHWIFIKWELQFWNKKGGCPCWQSSISRQICHVFNVRVHEGALKCAERMRNANVRNHLKHHTCPRVESNQLRYQVQD